MQQIIKYDSKMKAQIELLQKPNQQAVANSLARNLTDETVLYIKTRNIHWNIEGADVHKRQEFLESHLQQLDEIVDNIKERLCSYGH